MKIFTYYDYIKGIHSVRRNFISGLAEESTKYNLIPTKDDKKENKPHDKLIKEILKDKKEVVNLINKFLKPKEKIKEEEIEKYTNSYINKKYKSKEADIVYKMKHKDVYFLIEHQSTVDYNMPYRILNYCIDIVQEWKKEQKNRFAKYPIIVPIVVYTGQTKWNVPRNYKDQQIKTTTFDQYRIDLEYNLIDVNLYNIKDLLEKETMFSYALIMEKSKDKESFVRNIKLIVEKENNKERLDKIWEITTYLFGGILGEDGQEEVFKFINEKVGEKDMEALVQRIVEEEKRQRKELERKAEKRGEKIGQVRGEKIGQVRGEKIGQVRGEKIGQAKGERIGKEKAKQEIISKIKKRILNSNEDEKIIKKVNDIINDILITN